MVKENETFFPPLFTIFNLMDYPKHIDIIKLLGRCIATWYAMSRSLIKLTEIGTSWGVARQ